VILDTAGRLNIDERMMQEVMNIRQRVQPREVLLIADAMTGQEAVRVADDFNKAVSLTGMILTKMDGDARGGAALSIPFGDRRSHQIHGSRRENGTHWKFSIQNVWRRVY